MGDEQVQQMAKKAMGKRLRERMLACGYRRDDGEPNVRDFAFDYRFDKGHLHAWLAGKMMPFKNIVELCRALDCSIEWLLTGEERETKKATSRQGRGKIRGLLLALVAAGGLVLWPSGRASASPHALWVVNPLHLVRLIGSWRRLVRGAGSLTPGIAYA